MLMLWRKNREDWVLAREMNYCYEQPADVTLVVFSHSGVVAKYQRQHLRKIPEQSRLNIDLCAKYSHLVKAYPVDVFMGKPLGIAFTFH